MIRRLRHLYLQLSKKEEIMRLAVLLLLGCSLVWVSHAQSCRDYTGTACAEHPGCTMCKMSLAVVKVEFCVEDEIAAQLPSGGSDSTPQGTAP